MEKSFFADESEDKQPGGIPDLEETETKSSTGSDDDVLGDEGRIAAIMSYIPFLCFVPLLKMRQNPVARFHARQGVMLFLLELVAVLFLIDGISDFVFKAVLIVAAAASLAGIYFALKGENYRLPIISDLADKLKL